MERIVLGYDGTPAAVSALRWVAARAAREVAHVAVVTVVSRFSRDRESALTHLADAEAYLRDAVPGVGIELHRLEGRVHESLAGIRGADLVVVGVNTAHPVQSIAAGAVPLRVITASPAPVVLVPPGWVDSGAPVTVGVAADESADHALRFAGEEADAAGASLRLVHAWRMPLPTIPGSAALQVRLEAEMERERTALDRAMRAITTDFPGVEVSREFVQDDPATALQRYGSRSSLLVIGTHRRGLVDGAMLGSVAQQLVWRATCPIAVVGAAAPRRGGEL